MEAFASEENNTEQKLKLELLEMRKIDQEMRKSGFWDGRVDKKNTERMKEIVREYGWPSISKVGEEGYSAAWLLVQHADEDISFQEYCLSLLKKLPNSEVRKRDVAQLEDRILVNKGLPQIYGTQFFKDEHGRYVPRVIKEVESVEERRKSVGLPPLLEDIDLMNKK